MKSLIGIFLLSIVFSLEEQAEIGFLYGVLGRMNTEDEKTVVLQDSSIIHTGDEVRVNAGYQKETHFYVIYKETTGDFTLLYSDKNKTGENLSELPDTIYTTVLSWAEFSDPTGYETFFLINSTLFQENLVHLFNRYDKVSGKGKKKIAKQIQNEIDALNPDKKQDLANIGGRLNKPVVGGVTFRGDDEDKLKDISLTHTCKGNSDLAFKKIILNHQ